MNNFTKWIKLISTEGNAKGLISRNLSFAIIKSEVTGSQQDDFVIQCVNALRCEDCQWLLWSLMTSSIVNVINVVLPHECARKTIIQYLCMWYLHILPVNQHICAMWEETRGCGETQALTRRVCKYHAFRPANRGRIWSPKLCGSSSTRCSAVHHYNAISLQRGN